MNAIVAGKQEKQPGSLIWKSVLELSIPFGSNNRLYSADAYNLYRNDISYFIRIENAKNYLSGYINMSTIPLLNTSGGTYTSPGNYIQIYNSYYLSFNYYANNLEVWSRFGTDSVTMFNSSVLKSLQIGYFE